MAMFAKIVPALGVVAVYVAACGAPKDGLVLISVGDEHMTLADPASVGAGAVVVHRVMAQPQASRWGAVHSDRQVVAVDCVRVLRRVTDVELRGHDGAVLHHRASVSGWETPESAADRDTVRFACDARYAKAGMRAGTDDMAVLKRRYLRALQRQARA